MALILWVVALLLHRYLLPLLAVRVTLPPWQNVVAPLAVMVAVGNELTVTVVGALAAEQL